MLSSGTGIDWPQTQPMNEMVQTTSSARPMSSFQNKTSIPDVVRKVGAATAADQQAAAAAAPLKCPRCDSSNTKFCYYNNYSLSQPRHFCKACKRYWTRGGTLRNVPVGGGCRKTKQRVRHPNNKPSSGQRGNSHDNNGLDHAISRRQTHMDEPSLGLNGLIYGKNGTNSEVPDNGFGGSRLTSLDLGARLNSSPSGYKQLRNLGSGFSSGDRMMNESAHSSYLSAYSTLFGSNLPSSSAISSASTLMGSLLGSGHEYEKFLNESSSFNKVQNPGMGNNFQSILPLGEIHIGGNGAGYLSGMKVEDSGQVKVDQQMVSLSSSSMDPSLYNWNNGASNMNSWPDLPNMGFSVMSLL